MKAADVAPPAMLTAIVYDVLATKPPTTPNGNTLSVHVTLVAEEAPTVHIAPPVLVTTIDGVTPPTGPVRCRPVIVTTRRSAASPPLTAVITGSSQFAPVFGGTHAHAMGAVTMPELHVPYAAFPPHVGHASHAEPQKPGWHASHAAAVHPFLHKHAAPALTFAHAPAPHVRHAAELVDAVDGLYLSRPHDVHAAFPVPAA